MTFARSSRFADRAGRVISLSRVALSAVFLLATWLDPTSPSAFPRLGYALLIAYLAFAIAVMKITWDSWRMDWALAVTTHAVDILVFAVMVFLTDGFTSPFYTVFVFLLFSAAVRWDWHRTALTAAVVALLFFVAAVLALQYSDGEFELQRALLRTSYLVVVSLLFVWFGGHLKGRHHRRSASDEDMDRSLRDLLEDIAREAHAEGAIALWWDEEEPWIYSGRSRGGAYEFGRVNPADLLAFTDGAGRCKSLLGDARGGLGKDAGSDGAIPVDAGALACLCQVFSLHRVVAAAFAAGSHAGWLVVADPPPPSVDDLDRTEAQAERLARHFARTARETDLEKRAIIESHELIARDLHDSVAQIMAGTSFRLEVLRRSANGNGEIVHEIDQLQTELATEQKDLRLFIRRMRGEVDDELPHNLVQELNSVAKRIKRQWGVDCCIGDCSMELELSPDRLRDLSLLIREAAANAAKHGAARRIEIDCVERDGHLQLLISDDGSGFEHPVEPKSPPRSLFERARLLGGEMTMSSPDRGAKIRISLPLERSS